MKARLLLGVLAALVLFAPSAYAVIGWTGNVWPCNNATVAENQDVNVYLQVWKEGVTDGAGQGADITATLYYKKVTDAVYQSVAMTYNVDVGNNDEYVGTIPTAALEGGVAEMFYTEVTDLTDMSTCPPTSSYGCGGDQCSNLPPFSLNVTAATRQDVTVRFRLCLTAGIETSGAVCVTGGHAALTNWGAGVQMPRPCPETSPKYYEVDVLFGTGSNPYVEYKYKKDECNTWEGTGNHNFTIDDTAPVQVLWMDGWEYIPPDCPSCAVPVNSSTWGQIKALYR